MQTDNDKKYTTERTNKPYSFNQDKLKVIVAEFEKRREDWRRNIRRDLDVADILEMRNPQSVIEFVNQIIVSMKNEEIKHMYPHDYLPLERENSELINERYRKYLIDWLAELHYKFRMWPETLFVAVGIIDKFLIKMP
jgi:hypothetical protein